MGERFERAWTASRDAVPAARHAVLDWLRDEKTSDPPLSDVGLAVSEAVTNVVNHAYVGQEPGEVRVAIDADDRELRVVVEDDGAGMRPRPDSPGLGLGLPLIATVSERFDTITRPGEGTRLCIWFLRDPAAATLES